MNEFPGTAERADELKEKFNADFEIARRMLNAWVSRPIDRWLARSDLPGEVLSLAWLFNTQACRQYRSVIDLCEKGEGEVAMIVARSLFETELGAHFVLAPRLNIVVENRRGKAPHYAVLPNKWKSRVRKKGERATSIARRKRALIYAAHCVAQSVEVADELSERHFADTGERLEPALDPRILATAKRRIGQRWEYIQSNHPNSYSGLNVRELADASGGWFPRWYATIYPDQSRQVHGVDAFSYVSWFSTDETIGSALYCANTLFLCFMSLLHLQIDFRNATDMLIQGFLEDLYAIYPPAG